MSPRWYGLKGRDISNSFLITHWYIRRNRNAVDWSRALRVVAQQFTLVALWTHITIWLAHGIITWGFFAWTERRITWLSLFHDFLNARTLLRLSVRMSNPAFIIRLLFNRLSFSWSPLFGPVYRNGVWAPPLHSFFLLKIVLFIIFLWRVTGHKRWIFHRLRGLLVSDLTESFHIQQIHLCLK